MALKILFFLVNRFKVCEHTETKKETKLLALSVGEIFHSNLFLSRKQQIQLFLFCFEISFFGGDQIVRLIKYHQHCSVFQLQWIWSRRDHTMLKEVLLVVLGTFVLLTLEHASSQYVSLKHNLHGLLVH